MKTPNAREFRSVVTRLISQVLNLPTVQPSMSIHNTLEWDSLAHLQILAALEDYFDCELDLEEISEVQSVQNWIDVINRHHQ